MCWLAIVLLGLPVQAGLYQLQVANPNVWLASTLLVIIIGWLMSGFALSVYAKKRLEGAAIAVWPQERNRLYLLGYLAMLVCAGVFWALGYTGRLVTEKYEGVLVVLILYLLVVAIRGLYKCFNTYRLARHPELQRQALQPEKGQKNNKNQKQGSKPKTKK